MVRWVRWSPAASGAKTLCVLRNQEFGDIFDALEYLVARDPSAGYKFSNDYGGLYLLKSAEAVDFRTAPVPVAKIVYRFDEKTVAIMMASC